MGELLSRLTKNAANSDNTPKLLRGTGSEQKHLLIVLSADRGLAGGFNANAIREARRQVAALTAQGKDVKIITIGRKIKEALRRQYADRIIESHEEISKPRLTFAIADKTGRACFVIIRTGRV